jgi:hypothetical protein
VSVIITRVLPLLAFLGVAAWAPEVAACPVCLSATDGTREAYYGTTALLMVLPPLLFGSIVYWLYRAARARERLEREHEHTEPRLPVHPASLGPR